MTDAVPVRKPTLADDFRDLTTKQWVSVVLGIIIAVVLAIFVSTQCFGFLIAAIFLYMIPHLMGVKSVKVKALAGVIFLILGMAVATMATSSSLEDMEDGINGGQISDYAYDESTGALSFTIEMEDDQHVLVELDRVNGVAFGSLGYSESTLFLQPGHTLDTTNMSDSVTIVEDAMTVTPLGDGKFSVTVSGVALYADAISIMLIGVSEQSSAYFQILYNDSGESYMQMSLVNAAYVIGVAFIAFAIILVFSHLMRSSAEKTRKRMEAEGRLYPQGYGSCKQCGAIVLPGEITCRKCGAYIDVPEEMRVHKKDYFECSECGAEVPADATECPRCGARFDEPDTEGEEAALRKSVELGLNCPDCGAAVPPGGEWCPRCGRMLKKD